MEDKIKELLSLLMEDWTMMQQTAGDEGADWAERFEMHFYSFSEELRTWMNKLTQKPETLEEAENLPLIQHIINTLPTPLSLNLTIELEEIIDNIATERFD